MKNISNSPGKRTKTFLIFMVLVFFISGCSWFNNNVPLAENNADELIEENKVAEDYKQPTSFVQIMAVIEEDFPEWINDWRDREENFKLKDFKLVKSLYFELGEEKDYFKELTDLEKKFYILSPDQTRYLNIYGDILVFEHDGKIAYEAETVEYGILSGPAPKSDFKSSIVNVINNTSQTFIPGHGLSGTLDTIWLNNNEFIILGVHNTDEGLIPIIKYFNIEDLVVTSYEFDQIPRCAMSKTCPEDMTTVKVFYTACPARETKEYERTIKKTPQMATAALKELFIGLRDEEIQEGQEYLFDGPNYIDIKEIKIIDSIAYVNLNDIRYLFTYHGPYSNMDNSTKRNCEEFAFFEQANKTLTQFSTIKDAIYFIEGETYLFYDFMDIACPGDLCQNNPFTPSMDKTYIYMNACNDPVRPFMRLIPKDHDKIKTTLQELFSGPYENETQRGQYNIFSNLTANILKNIVIKDEIAYVNLEDFRKIIPAYDSHCYAAQFFAAVGTTLTQFSEIKDAIYFINGDIDTFYSFMKVDCPYKKECQYNPFK